MISKFNTFVAENFSDYDGTLGQYIGGLAKSDERVAEIVASYTKETDQSVDIVNAIDVLSDTIKVSLLKNVEKHINDEEAEVKVSTSSTDEPAVDTEYIEPLDESYGGKGLFSSFLKCLTALGFKDNKVSSDTPSNFLYIFRFIGKSASEVQQVFNRYKSLQKVKLEEGKTYSLYYGLRTDGMMEYGTYINEMEPIGEFKLGKRDFNKFKTTELKSLSGFKRLTVDMDYNDNVLFLKLKQVMSDFDPGKIQTKMPPFINGRIMTFGYYGYGTWSSGNISPQDLENIKNEIKDYLSKYKWTEKCMIGVTAKNFWVYINIKLK